MGGYEIREELILNSGFQDTFTQSMPFCTKMMETHSPSIT